MSTPTSGRIVLRGENTAAARAALRWAVAEAARTGATVLVVAAFDVTQRADLALERDLAQARREARYRAQSWVVESVADLDTPVPVRVSTPDGPVLRELLSAAAGAQALVLGPDDPGLAAAVRAADPCPVHVVEAQRPVPPYPCDAPV